ncbi:S66 peptidase family protein [Streptantibioticus ferralitis]|uniref:LD-carboxypeptidase n=1 Tax=Streptantibioticus ferralitis TaxID=236510 RepID=A0ABT5Z1K3_9ACTN|nr:S66 peptidase family protein [Streptantibioticus ferralitis]MDF2257723.1 LD-carboxypeptidase [Streptantibioticus ferralitis]
MEDHGTKLVGPRAPSLPPALRPGDLVGVCTPSGPVAGIAGERFRRGVRALEGFEWRVVVGPQAQVRGYSAGSARARAEEINAFLRDERVRAIFTTIGGFNANGVLPHLDYDALRSDPKIIVGYSDITAILLGVHARTGVTTFHGPTLMPEFAEYPEMLSYSADSLLSVVTGPGPCNPLRPPASWTEEFLLWDEEDKRARRLEGHPGWKWVGSMSGRGPLLGGNLETLCCLLGTPYLPSFEEAVLFWETCDTSMARLDRSLCQLDAAGVTSGLAGMVVGRSFRGGEAFENELRTHVTQRYADHGFPLVMNVDIGHTDPMLTLPVGAIAALDASSRTFRLTTSGVRAGDSSGLPQAATQGRAER